jgi:hypothetical protein
MSVPMFNIREGTRRISQQKKKTWVQRTRQFWRHVLIKGFDECWPWLGACNGAYGQTLFDTPFGTLYRAHTIAFFLATGVYPGGSVIRHTCDNPPCCNPRHLKKGTQLDNVLDKVAKGRQARGQDSGNAKLTNFDVLCIRRLYAVYGLSKGCIGRIFGTDRKNIFFILRGSTWKHLKG